MIDTFRNTTTVIHLLERSQSETRTCQSLTETFDLSTSSFYVPQFYSPMDTKLQTLQLQNEQVRSTLYHWKYRHINDGLLRR